MRSREHSGRRWVIAALVLASILSVLRTILLVWLWAITLMQGKAGKRN